MLVCSFVISTVLAQNDEGSEYKFKHSVGVQANPYPYIGQGFSWNRFQAYSYALRYGYSINEKFTLGIEFSAYQYKMLQYKYVMTEGKALQAGLLGRYRLPDLKNFKPFVEISLYYRDHDSWVQLPHDIERTFNNDLCLSGFVALGANWRLFTDRLSLDVMYKFSNREFVNSRKHVMTYRLNFHF